jgi:hypothetical protein
LTSCRKVTTSTSRSHLSSAAFGTLNGGEVEFDIPGSCVSSVAIPKRAKPGEMITIRVEKETDKGAKAAAEGKAEEEMGFAAAGDGLSKTLRNDDGDGSNSGAHQGGSHQGGDHESKNVRDSKS